MSALVLCTGGRCQAFKKLKPSVNAPGVGPNSALSFISPLFLSFDINSFYLAADFKRITSYTEELIQNARDRPSKTRAILEPCLASFIRITC